jgi:Iron-sulfur cluster-binding domain
MEWSDHVGGALRLRSVMPCQDMWLSPQISWDGKMLGCCVNVWGDYGNVFESSLDECLTSEKYRYAQKMLLVKRKRATTSPA